MQYGSSFHNIMNIISAFYFLLIASAILFIFTDEISASDCSDPSDKFTQTKPIPGGISKTSQSSPEIIQAAKQLQNEINQSSSQNCQVKLTKILNASTQVVAGEMIRLQVELCPVGGGCDVSIQHRGYGSKFFKNRIDHSMSILSRLDLPLTGTCQKCQKK